MEYCKYKSFYYRIYCKERKLEVIGATSKRTIKGYSELEVKYYAK
jgi:hypothetical protein